MGDSDSTEKKLAAPSWQTELKSATPTEGDSDSPPPSRETLVDQARKFLEEDEVRNASTDKKISFLESKGLNSEEIQSLIGVTRHADASASSTTVRLYDRHMGRGHLLMTSRPHLHFSPDLHTHHLLLLLLIKRARRL